MKGGKGGIGGMGVFLWKISVALYLIANGILGIQTKGGDFKIIFQRIGFQGDALFFFAMVISVIAVIAGIAIILEMLNVKLSFMYTLIFIVAIIWVVYIVIEIVSWITSGFYEFWKTWQTLAVHLMVFASLLIASKKFS
jgi:hypothetical protein